MATFFYQRDSNQSDEKDLLSSDVKDYHTDALFSVAMSANGEHALTASLSSKNSNIFWKLANGIPYDHQALEPLSLPIERVISTRDGRWYLTVDVFNTIRLWDFCGSQDKKCVLLQGPPGKVLSLCIAPDARWAAAAIECSEGETMLVLWDLRFQDDSLCGSKKHNYYILRNDRLSCSKNMRIVCISEDGRWLVSGAIGDKKKRLCTAIRWDLSPVDGMNPRDFFNMILSEGTKMPISAAH